MELNCVGLLLLIVINLLGLKDAAFGSSGSLGLSGLEWNEHLDVYKTIYKTIEIPI